MPRSQSLRPRTPPWTVVLGLATLFVSGVALILITAFMKFHGSEIGWEFARDLGIALVVSGVVASLFELYRSVRHHLETMRDVIDLTMGEQITPEVWLELKELIQTRKVIRRNVRLRWSLSSDSTLTAPDAILHIEYEYELHSLTNKGGEFTIEHELDYHLQNARADLPRFDRVIVDLPQVDAYVLEGEKLKEKCKGGKLCFDIRLQPRDGEPARVRVERSELVHIPGSYNFYTPDFIKGLHIYYGECPEHVRPEILVRPLGHGLVLKHVGNNWSCEHLLLPGQGVEIKFPMSSPDAPRAQISRETGGDSAADEFETLHGSADRRSRN